MIMNFLISSNFIFIIPNINHGHIMELFSKTFIKPMILLKIRNTLIIRFPNSIHQVFIIDKKFSIIKMKRRNYITRPIIFNFTLLYILFNFRVKFFFNFLMIMNFRVIHEWRWKIINSSISFGRFFYHYIIGQDYRLHYTQTC